MMQFLKEYVLAQQYNPGFFGLWLNPYYHARKGLYQAIAAVAPEFERGRVLDVGCGRKPYQGLFQAEEYVGLEIDTPENRERKQADFFYHGDVFPFEDHSFDGVVCNQVLEHVFAPEELLAEIRRVLKSEGRLLMTIPFVWDEHEQPWDYARYSSFGLKSLLEKNGFEVLVQRKINADVRLLFQLINAYFFKVFWSRYPVLNAMLCIILMAPFNIVGALVYRLLPSNPDLYLDQLVLAKRI